MRNLKLENDVQSIKMRVIHKRLMRIQNDYTAPKILGICLFAISVLFVCADLLALETNTVVPAYSLNQGFALLSFGLAAYFSFVGRFKIRHPDFVFSAFVLQFLFILFAWLSRFDHSFTAIGI